MRRGCYGLVLGCQGLPGRTKSNLDKINKRFGTIRKGRISGKLTTNKEVMIFKVDAETLVN